MSAATMASPGSPTMRRKKMLKKLTVATDTANAGAEDQLPTMATSKSPTTMHGSPRRSTNESMLKAATRGRAASNGVLSPKVAAASGEHKHQDSKKSDSIASFTSPATPSRSGDRKHVDSAIITKLQKLGMQDPANARTATGALSNRNSPKLNKPVRERLAVILDMDECMLHTTSFSEGDTQRYRQEEDRPTLRGGKAKKPIQVHFKMFDGCRGTANLRPNLAWFLDKCTANFDTYVFTAGTEAYASPLLDLVDPERKLKGRFYRTSCRRVVCELGELYLKDLSSLPVPQPLSRMVLVDNNPVSFLVQPCNGIPVVSWYDNVHDVVLKEVFDILKDLSALDDVRSKLDNMFGLKVELRALRRTVGLKNAFEATSSNSSTPSSGKGVKKSSLPPVNDGTTW